MKKITSAMLILAFVTSTILGCKKKTTEEPVYKCTTCKTTPDAVAANDASNKGVYKGVIIGSSGTIKFDLSNTGTTITATMVLDGITATLTSTVAIVAGTTYVGAFTGTWNGQPVSVTFSVNPTGQNPVVTAFNIPGHATSSFNIIKETSNQLIECFEGTYDSTRPEKGTFNIVLSRGLKIFSGSAKKDQGTVVNSFNGKISDANKLIDASDGKTLATLTGDVLAEVFVDGNNATITIKGKRTF
ncbi:hypothetical protein [Pedobacter frigiditerrae]|uniref:hypothetical protein n=1 Tax=Pedobacter frigiditerrae TaxID=2530452 RepID=UPI00293061B6|nr:hypothetical protein [Pedobacter frigiditerrae]